MSQRDSGYERKALDQYETPHWVTLALIPHLPVIGGTVWEPAAGSGKMVAALRQAGFDVLGTDIATGTDFLRSSPRDGVSAVITNPPYALAREFIEHALRFDAVRITAVLLRTDFDHAATRAHLFADCPAFAKKIVLTKRIRWIEGSTGSPSFNHAWFMWDRTHRGPPELTYEHHRGHGRKHRRRRQMTFIATAETQEAYDIAHGTVRVYGPDYTHDASHVWDPYHGEMPPGIWLSPDGNWRTIFLPGEEESCGRNFCYCPFCKGLRAGASI